MPTRARRSPQRRVSSTATRPSPPGACSAPAGREAFRAALAVDGGTWERARGTALHQAALIIPYYAKTNRGFVALARRTIEEVLAGSGS